MPVVPRLNTPKLIKFYLLTITLWLLKSWREFINTIRLLLKGWRPVKGGKWKHTHSIPGENVTYTTLAHNKEWALRHMQTQEHWLPKK